MFLSLFSFHPNGPKENWLGLVGYGIAYGLTYLFGIGSFLLMLYLGYLSFKFLSRGELQQLKVKNFYFATFLLACCILMNLIAEIKAPFPDILMQKVPVETIVFELPFPQVHMRHNLGGVPLYYLYRDLPTLNLRHLLSDVGIAITFSIIGIVSCLLFTEMRTLVLWEKGRKLGLWIFQKMSQISLPKKSPSQIQKAPEEIEESLSGGSFPILIFLPKKWKLPLLLRLLKKGPLSE